MMAFWQTWFESTTAQNKFCRWIGSKTAFSMRWWHRGLTWCYITYKQISLMCLCCRHCFTCQVWSADIPAISWEPAQFKSQIRQSLSGQLRLPVSLSIRLYICLSVLWCLLVFWMSACLYACLSIHLLLCLSVHTICLFVCLSVRLSICAPAFVSACLSVYDVSGRQYCTTADCTSMKAYSWHD